MTSARILCSFILSSLSFEYVFQAFHSKLSPHLFRPAHGNNSPFIQKYYPVTHLFHLFHIVRCIKDGYALLLFYFSQKPSGFISNVRVKACCWFIQKQYFRIIQKGLDKTDSGYLAGRKTSYSPVP